MLVDDEVYDLRVLQTLLPAEGYGSLGRALRKWIVAHSVAADLAIAAENLREAILLRDTSGPSTDRVCAAILHSAIVAYARSTERRSRHRGTLNLGGAMSPEQRQLHDQLLELRDESLAHFGPAGVEAPWSEDHAIIIRTGMAWCSALVARRRLFDSRFAERVVQHLDAIEKMAADIATARRIGYEAIFYPLAHDDDLFCKALVRSRMNPSLLGGWNGPVLGGEHSGRRIHEG